MNQAHALLLQQRFPLVARPKPLCPPLGERVAEIERLARAASINHDLAAAASTCNRAALIASDCGLPELAETWCRRHFAAYWARRPLTGFAVTFALEPLINLARLEIRSRSGTAAHQLLGDLYQAVRRHKPANIAGTTLDFAELTSDTAAHREAVTKLWTILLADATRALISTGNWPAALAHVTEHKGIGARLLDGRQIAIITLHLAGDSAAARKLLDDSTLTEHWEQVVAKLLQAVQQPSQRMLPGLVESYLVLDQPAALLPFQTRLGAAIVEVVGDTDPVGAAAVTTRVITTAIRSRNGYVARDVLAHAGLAKNLTTSQRATLAAAVTDSLLDAKAIPAHHLGALECASELALTTTEKILSTAATVS